jgi:toxin ParE1/3/4
VRKRETAKRDLIAQWLWYAETSSIKTADRFLEAANATLKFLARHPEGGARCGFRTPRLRKVRRFPIGDGFESILLFYSPSEEGIDLVRVIHGKRDLKRVVEKGS